MERVIKLSIFVYCFDCVEHDGNRIPYPFTFNFCLLFQSGQARDRCYNFMRTFNFCLLFRISCSGRLGRIMISFNFCLLFPLIVDGFYGLRDRDLSIFVYCFCR